MKQSKPTSSTQSPHTKASHHRLSTSSDETEVKKQPHNNNEWQTMRKQKRYKTTSPGPRVPTPPNITQTRYAILAQNASQAEPEGKPLPPLPQNHQQPPIFIHGIINYGQMIKCIREVAKDEQYFTKSMASNVI